MADVLAAVRGVAEAVALAGAGWLTALAVVAWLQLPALPTPDAIGDVPWPTALLLGGFAVRLLLGVLTRVWRGRVLAGTPPGTSQDRARLRDVVEARLLTPVRPNSTDQRLRAA